MGLNFSLHAAQTEMYEHPARFKVLSAGRRGGKTHYGAVELLLDVLKSENAYGRPLTEKNVTLFGAPSLERAREIIWPILKELVGEYRGTGRGKFQFKEKDLHVIAPNGRRIVLKGLDNPDSGVGSSYSLVVLDEFALVKPQAWEVAIRPALTDVRGRAILMSTPRAEAVHFTDLWESAGNGSKGPEWAAFNFATVDNPFGGGQEEVDLAAQDMTEDAFKREFLGIPCDSTEGAFKEQFLPPIDPTGHIRSGETYIAVDLMGFTDGSIKSRADLHRRDESVICVANVGPQGWHILDMQHGRWDVRETAARICGAYRQYRPMALGIEKGTTKNAVGPYLEDYKREYGVRFEVQPLTHGNKKKHERILWSLQGRFQKGRVTLAEAPWNHHLWEQARRFPSPQAHDDMLDALAYIDQISTTLYHPVQSCSYFETGEDIILDEEAGY